MAYEDLGFLPDPAVNPDGIGSTPGDKRRMTDAQRLQTLLAQRDDPARDPGSTPELEREIARLQKLAGAGDDLGFVPDATPPAASQRDVRAAERYAPDQTPMEGQKAAEDRFAREMQRYIQATGGVIPPGKNIRQAVEEWSGVQDPNRTRDKSELDELRAGGNLQYGDSVPYAAAKAAAGMGGFAAGGPAGATGAEAAVRFSTLAWNLKKAVDAGAIDQDRAAEIMAKEMVKGTGEDAAFNFGVPLLGHVVAKIPGMSWLADKAAAYLTAKGLQMTGPTAAEAAQRARALERLKAQADTPAGKQAVEDLGKRTEASGTIPTPGQVTGEVSTTEGLARKGSPTVFAKQSSELEDAAEGMRQDLVNPSVQPEAKDLGNSILQTAEKAQAAVKARHRPTFEAADNLGVSVDFSGVLQRAKAALAADSAVPGGRLLPKERADLEALVAQLEGTSQNGLASNMRVSPEAALDFMSRQKEKLRSLTADYKPSAYFDTVVNGLTKDADSAFSAAAAKAGKGDVVKNLNVARGDYREMMETIYDDAVKSALKKNPEDIGRLFWQRGNVSEIEQLQKLLGIAQREGTMSAGQATKLSRDVTRGFMQEAVPNVEAAANWSTKLNENPALRRTWDTLTAQPGGSQLRGAMEVLEKAAQIAGRNSSELLKDQVIPIIAQRSASGSMGVSNVSVKPGWIATGLSITGLTKAMATAYTQGNKGVLNAVMRALRANSAGTAAGAQALQESLNEIQKFAAANGQDDVIEQRPVQ